MKRSIRWAVAGLAAVSLMSAAPAAMAGSVRTGGVKAGVDTKGACSMSSTWRLHLRPEDPALLRVAFTVRENLAGDTWSVTLKDNGIKIFHGQKTTAGPDGEFTVRKRTSDQAGTDHVVASATNQRTGETCRGSASI